MKVKFYTLSDPRNPDEVRYVGKTMQSIGRRLTEHMRDAKLYKSKQPTYKGNYNYNWINSLLNQGVKPIIKEIYSLELEEKSTEWRVFEKHFIAQFKSWGFRLTNLTEGGDGNQNQVFSRESIEKRNAKLRGRPRSQETRDKLSKAHMGKKLSEVTKERVRRSIIKLQGRPILQYTMEGIFLREWECIQTAATFYNVDSSSIMRCCQGQFKKSRGFIWKYKNEDIV